jgi:dolichol-phosphate mannosyltransferase
MKILIVIPTYNERDNIERLLGRLLNLRPDLEMLVVDDNSPDGTGELVRQISQANSRIHLLSRTQKNGIGPAYIAGFKWGLARDYDVLIEMDADLSHRPRYLPKFIELLENHDVVAGSRWMPGGGIANWPINRVLLSRFANIYSRLVMGVPIYDLTGGYTAYRRAVLETIGLEDVRSDGYCFQIEMKYRSFLKGFRIVETPIWFTDRKAGDSKISRHIVYEALLMVWRLRFNRRRLANYKALSSVSK